MTMDNMLEQHNHILEVQYDVVMNKLKHPRKQIDLPVLIKQLRNDTGLTLQELANETGYSLSFLSKLENESRAYDEITKAFNLLFLFLKNTDRNIPIVGEYNE